MESLLQFYSFNHRVNSSLRGAASDPVKYSVFRSGLKSSLCEVAPKLLLSVVLVHAGAHLSVLLPADEDDPETVPLSTFSEGLEGFPTLLYSLSLEPLAKHLLVVLPQRPHGHSVRPSIRLDVIRHLDLRTQ